MSERYWVRREIQPSHLERRWIVAETHYRGPFDDIKDAQRAAGLADSFNNPREQHIVWTEGVIENHVVGIEAGLVEPVLCKDCGKPEGTFACKIRHIQVNTGWAKSAND